MASETELDFIVIGVQKGGTTSLWQYLRKHPGIAMPDYKEASIFCMPAERIAPTMEEFMRRAFPDAGPHARLGKVATHYMMGVPRIDVRGIVELVAGTFPGVRLLALLRDPIERAMSHYMMSVRRGFEQRSFDRAVEELLEPDGLAVARSRATEENSYLAQGEYGRILGIYRERFPAEQLHAELTAELARDPGGVIDRILAFLDLPPGFRPDGLGVRHHRGGRRQRIDDEGEVQLRGFMEEQVWPRLGAARENVKLSFDFFMQTWNVVPDDLRPALSAENRRRLEDHFAGDGEKLAALGIAPAWLDAWAKIGREGEP